MENVIKGLSELHGSFETMMLISEAIVLLKEHKEHEELLTKLGYHWTGSGETLALCRMKDGEHDA